ncbi:MAG: Gfo/Idh/MocA family protein [Planctomycetota bacterium]
MVTRPLRLGLYGCGARTRTLLNNVKGVIDFEVAAAYDLIDTSAREVADNYGGRVVETPEALMSADDVDAFMVSLYPGAHGDVLVKLLPVGKPIYIEKPIATTPEQAERVRRARAEHPDTLVHVGIMHRYVEVFRRVKQLTHAGRVGELVSVHANWVARMGDPEHFPGGINNWHFHPETGGELIQHQCHQFDWFRQLGGDIVAVTATTNQPHRKGLPVEDTINVSLEFASGVLASGHYSQNNPRNTIMGWIEGTGGSIEWEWGEPSRIDIYEYHPGQMHTDPVEHKEMDPGFDEAGRRGIVDFVKAVRGEIEPRVTIDDALRSVEIGFAVRESARTGRRVTLD